MLRAEKSERVGMSSSVAKGWSTGSDQAHREKVARNVFQHAGFRARTCYAQPARPSSPAGPKQPRSRPEMSFVAVFTASAMGFTLLVPILMVVVLLAYSAPARRAVRLGTEPVEGGTPRGGSTSGADLGADVSRLAA